MEFTVRRNLAVILIPSDSRFAIATMTKSAWVVVGSLKFKEIQEMNLWVNEVNWHSPVNKWYMTIVPSYYSVYHAILAIETQSSVYHDSRFHNWKSQVVFYALRIKEHVASWHFRSITCRYKLMWRSNHPVVFTVFIK